MKQRKFSGARQLAADCVRKLRRRQHRLIGLRRWSSGCSLSLTRAAHFFARLGIESNIGKQRAQRNAGHDPERDGEIHEAGCRAACERHRQVQYARADTDAERQRQLLEGGVEAGRISGR